MLLVCLCHRSSIDDDPQNEFDDRSDCPGDREAKIDAFQSVVDRKHRVDPKKSDTADAHDHQDRRQGGDAHSSNGIDKDIEYSV